MVGQCLLAWKLPLASLSIFSNKDWVASRDVGLLLLLPRYFFFLDSYSRRLDSRHLVEVLLTLQHILQYCRLPQPRISYCCCYQIWVWQLFNLRISSLWYFAPVAIYKNSRITSTSSVSSNYSPVFLLVKKFWMKQKTSIFLILFGLYMVKVFRLGYNSGLYRFVKKLLLGRLVEMQIVFVDQY